MVVFLRLMREELVMEDGCKDGTVVRKCSRVRWNNGAVCLKKKV